MRNILGSNRARLLGILLVGTALILACPLSSYANALLLWNLAPGGTDATKLVTACTDNEEEPVSFDIGSTSTDIQVTVSGGAFLDSEGASADAFLVRTTQPSGNIPLVISGDISALVWSRDTEDIQGNSGRLEADYDNNKIEWDFGQDNPGNSRIIEGSMVSSGDNECGVVVMKLEDKNYYLEVWNIDIDENSDTQTRLGVISSDGGTFTDVSMDLGSMVTSGDMYLAIANWGTKAISLDTASSDVTYEGTYAPDVSDDPAQFLKLQSGDLSPATAVLLKIKTNAASDDGCITIPTHGGGDIRLHTGSAMQINVRNGSRGTDRIGVTNNITSADVRGVSADIVNTFGAQELSIATPDNGGMVQFKVSGDIPPGVNSADAAFPMVIETNFRMESEDLFSGTDFNRSEEELAELVRERLTFVKTWDDGTTASISLRNSAAKVFITKSKTDRNTYSVNVRIQLRVLIVNGGTAGNTRSITVKGLPYLAIYDGSADGSIHDPITLEESSSDGGGGSGGCALGAVTPAALLLLLPLLAVIKK